MFRYLFLAGCASAVTLRNLKVAKDADNTTAARKNDFVFTKRTHGLTNGNKLYYSKGTDGTVQTGMVDGQVYIVADKTDDTFKLKTQKSATTAPWMPVEDDYLSSTNAIDGVNANTFTKVAADDNAAWCGSAGESTTTGQLKLTKTGGNGTTTTDNCDMAAGDTVVFVCYDTTTNRCTKETTAMVPALATKYKLLRPVAGAGGTNPEYKFTTTADAAVTLDMHDNTKQHSNKSNGFFKLSATTTDEWKPFTTTLKPSWDITANSVIGVSNGLKDTDLVWYTATTLAKPLKDHFVYSVFGKDITKDSVQLKAVDNALAPTGSAIDITAAGSGGSFTRVTMLGGDSTKSKVDVISTAGALTIASQAVVKDTKVRFYCFDKAKAKCADKLGSFTEGTTYYILTASNTVTSITLATSKDGTAVTSTAVATHQEKVFLLVEHDKYNIVPKPSAAGANGASRSLAMLGSAFGIFAAVLLA